MEKTEENNLEKQQERLADAVSGFLGMVNRPDWFANEIQVIAKGLDEPQLPPDAQKCMDEFVVRLRAILPTEDAGIEKEKIQDMVRAILEEGYL